MANNKFILSMSCVMMVVLAGCSRQQSDWQKARESNTTDSYEQYLKKYPSGEFTAQAQARAKELYEERDWQKARDADTPEAYQAFLKQYPEGKWTEEARIRVENFTLAQAPTGAAPATSSAAGSTTGSGTAAPPDKGPSLAKIVNPAPPHAAVTDAGPAAKPTPAATSAAGQSGGYAVQLGAFKSGNSAATKHWSDLQKKYPKILSGLSSHIVTTKTSSGTLHRLQSTGLTEKRARAVCEGLKANSEPCVLVPPA